MDSILLFGQSEDKIEKALRKMGYEVFVGTNGATLPAFIESKMVDLLVLSGRGNDDTLKTITTLRETAATKRLPILFLTDNNSYVTQIHDLRFDRIDCLDPSATLGSVISKAATLLRLRKMVGAEKDGKQNIYDVNAHLRDLTEKHKREIDEARRIQESLLPKTLPSGEGFEIEVVYIPLEELGGDIYDVRNVKEGKVSFLIADVTGHGLPAAFIGSMTKMAVVAVGKDMPDEMLTGMNVLMTPQMPQGRFVTMAAALYDPSNGKISFTRAGHPPAFVLKRSEGKVKELMAGGLAVGFLEDSIYSSEEETLQSGDIFVLITDGISEAQNRALEQYGHQRIAQALLSTKAEHSAKEVLTHLINSFLEFTQGRILKDDVTVIVLKKI